MRGSLSVFATSLTLVSAASHSSFRRERREPAGITKRYTTLTEQYATQTLSSDYLLSLNLWGMYSGSGSQTAVATSVSGDSVAWETTWSWSGGENSVKSYSNVGLTSGLGVALSQISSIPTTWDWKVSGGASSAVFDVSYDWWLSADPSCGNAVSCSTVEVMLWLGGYGACTPAGSKVGTVTVAGLQWEYWTGTVQNWAIYSFVAPSPITSYDGDLNDFNAYIIKNGGVSSSQYLTAVQAGTEPFTGSAVTFTTTAYSAKVVSGGEVIFSTSSSSVASTSSKAVSSSTTVKASATTTKAASTTTTKAPSTTVSSSSSASASSGACGSAYSQCGGQGFSDSTCCPSGYTCQVNNAYYSQCRPSSEASSVASTTAVASVSNPVLIVSSSSSTTTTTTSSAPSSSSSSVSSGSNLQPFSGAVNGISAPAITTGGRGYLVADVTDGSSFYTLDEAISRSCDNQHNSCAKAFNALPNGTATFTTADCDQQNTQCHASA